MWLQVTANKELNSSLKKTLYVDNIYYILNLIIQSLVLENIL